MVITPPTTDCIIFMQKQKPTPKRNKTITGIYKTIFEFSSKKGNLIFFVSSDNQILRNNVIKNNHLIKFVILGN